ncbi:hypothetical protein F0L74_21980 [Chitinophaga agrisoli]|uniref:YD repeat-containing protein n=1 Tax=Chitinophaga agrisoli TaxID=2607653 RepID=A0A5B2VK21_9BACT|nr:hypothetical protein [Chitinophaga agrisoli]KAA2238886.1 hypothetical protein F0L74_21980 [Chitinophaga agrisoli]
MKKLRLLTLLGIAFMYAACSKNDQSPPIIVDPPMGSNLLVASLVTNWDSLVFDYNTDNTLRRYADFSYNSVGTVNNIGQYYVVYKGDTADRFFFKPYLTGDSTLASRLAYNNTGNISTLIGDGGNHDSIIYDIRGKMTERYQFRANMLTVTNLFTYDGGDVVKVVDIFGDGSTGETDITTYTYLDKINPFRLLGLVPYLDQNKPYYFSSHLLAGWRYTTTRLSGDITSTYEYTYNTDGSPNTVKRTQAAFLDGDAETRVESGHFTYLKK